jgi:hypothetical protein
MNTPPTPRAPFNAQAWRCVGPDPLGQNGFAWQHQEISVISTLDMAELPGGNGAIGQQWHVSVSRFTLNGQKRPNWMQVKFALRAFGMLGAEEDNHHPGIGRSHRRREGRLHLAERSDELPRL